MNNVVTSKELREAVSKIKRLLNAEQIPEAKALIKQLEANLSKESEEPKGIVGGIPYDNLSDDFKKRIDGIEEALNKNKPSTNAEPQTKGAEEYLISVGLISKKGIRLNNNDYDRSILIRHVESYANQAVKKAEQRMKDALPHFLCVHCYEDKDAINEAKEEFLTHLKTNK